jgi:excisionase family DNA binding protein
MNTNVTDIISTQEAAKILGYSLRTTLRLIERGRLNAWKIDPLAKSVYRLSRKEVEKFRSLARSDAGVASTDHSGKRLARD